MTATPAAADWLSPAQIATQLGCSPDTVLRAIKRGHLRAVKYGRVVRISRPDFDRFLTRYQSRT